MRPFTIGEGKWRASGDHSLKSICLVVIRPGQEHGRGSGVIPPASESQRSPALLRALQFRGAGPELFKRSRDDHFSCAFGKRRTQSVGRRLRTLGASDLHAQARRCGATQPR
jgi:hypothetical protein